MKYPIAIETGNADTAWGVVVPDLPGCFSAGDTLDEAYSLAREAIGLWINTALDDGKPVPVPKPLATHQADPEYAGWSWAVVEVDMSAFDDSVERINITIPRRVLRQIDQYVARHHGNRSSFLAESALKSVYQADDQDPDHAAR